jgi:FkbM family methyltransferase
MITSNETQFLSSIEDNINVIFDVGCRDCSIFTSLKKEVHYFDPREDFIDILKNQPNNNTKAIFNAFGLSDKEETIEYDKDVESFFDRSSSIGRNGEKIMLEVKKANEYIIDNNITHIDFLKIDTEGFELKVLKGFENFLKNISIIQFEYGGTYIDAKITLEEVINYLKQYGFENFSYLRPNTLEPITDYTDHYQYSNIVCFNNENTLHNKSY